MFLPAAEVATCEARYGTPRTVAIEAPMTPGEMDRLVASQRHGRAHDITLFILEPHESGRRVVVIRKPQFPPGCWRPPSGGVHPGESMEAGALREAREETGLAVALTRYLVRVEARFVEASGRPGAPRAVAWTSHVFGAGPLGGILAPIDTGEIAEARWATLEELAGPIRAALLASGSGGLRYRARLHDAALAALGGA